MRHLSRVPSFSFHFLYLDDHATNLALLERIKKLEAELEGKVDAKKDAAQETKREGLISCLFFILF